MCYKYHFYKNKSSKDGENLTFQILSAGTVASNFVTFALLCGSVTPVAGEFDPSFRLRSFHQSRSLFFTTDLFNQLKILHFNVILVLDLTGEKKKVEVTNAGKGTEKLT